MNQISRRAALLGIPAIALGLSSCSSEPPMDEAELNRVVAQVDGVTSTDIKVKEGGGVSGWSLGGEIGLPDDPTEAHTVYENCLRAIASVPVSSEAPLGIYVYGVSASGELDPKSVGAPDGTTALRKHFS